MVSINSNVDLGLAHDRRICQFLSCYQHSRREKQSGVFWSFLPCFKPRKFCNERAIKYGDVKKICLEIHAQNKHIRRSFFTVLTNKCVLWNGTRVLLLIFDILTAEQKGMCHILETRSPHLAIGLHVSHAQINNLNRTAESVSQTEKQHHMCQVF